MGQRGELASRLLWLLAKVDTVEEHADAIDMEATSR